MQALDRTLTALTTREQYSAASSPADNPTTGSASLHAKNLHTYLAKLMYKRRTDFNPLWNVIVVAGLDGKDNPFLASVDLLGTTFESPTLATGFGAHLAQPILRRVVPDEEAVKNLGREEAVDLVKQCMKVLFYRDARSMDQYSIAVCERDPETKGMGKMDLKKREKLEAQSWAFADQIKGYGSTQMV